MSEHQPKHENTGEHHIPHHEANEHQERLNEHHEKAAEKAKKSTHETEQLARKAEKEAKSKEDYTQPTEKVIHQENQVRTRADKDHSFDTTMHHVRQNMSKPERAFSNFIHKPVVEKTSELLGKTVARPSGIAGATIAAFIGLLSIYSIAKFAGFELSGSEMPLLLAAGFVIGVFLEWVFKSVRVIISPRKS